MSSSIVNRLMSRRDIGSVSNCWMYTGLLDKDGYGKIKYKQKDYRVHRLAYEIFVGKPKGQVLHKLFCKNKNCFNPEHLYDGTHQDNMDDLKKNGHRNQHTNKTHCKRGHDLSKEYKNPKTGYRQCLTCRSSKYDY